MSKQINEYLKTRTFSDISVFDYLDFDSTDDNGTTFESAKCSVLDLLQYLQSTLPTLYGGDGTLIAGVNGDRNITTNSIETKFLGGNVSVEMIDGASDYGFLIRDDSQTEKARLGFEQSIDSSILELSDSGGVFLSAYDGFLGVNTVNQLGSLGQALTFNNQGSGKISGSLEVFQTLITGAGAKAKILSLSTSDMEIGTLAANKAITLVRGASVDYFANSIGSTFRSGTSATEAYQFSMIGHTTGKMQVIASDTTAGNPTSRTCQFDFVSNYWDGSTPQQSKIEVKQNVAINTGITDLDYILEGLSVFKIKDSGVINASNLPTTSAGLVSGDIWNDAGTLKII